jgi:hypothetical protein
MVVVETKEENDFLKSFMKTIEGVQNGEYSFIFNGIIIYTNVISKSLKMKSCCNKMSAKVLYIKLSHNVLCLTITQ